MSHEISIVNGIEEAAYAVKPAWHGLGTVVNQAMSSKEALEIAHLNWKVKKVPVLFDPEPEEEIENDRNPNCNIGISPYADLFKGKFVTYREDTRNPLGVVGKKYSICQNTEAFDFVDMLFEENKIEYESAIALKGGAKIALLAKMKSSYFVKENADEKIEDYLLFTNSHDGSSALTIALTNVRVVCMNTLNWALGSATKQMNIRHTKSIKDRMENVRETFGLIRNVQDNTHQYFDNLVEKKIQMADYQRFIDQVFPMPVVQDKEVNTTRIAKVRDQITENFYENHQEETTATKGTAYGLLNAVSKYVDHQRGVNLLENNREKRINSIWFGSGHQIKHHAMKVIGKL